MMKMKKLTALVAVLLSFMLVFAACDMVGGVNLNNVLKSPIEQESYEGKMNISIEVLPGDQSWITDGSNDLGLLSAFPGFEINIHEYKQQDLMTASFAGDLSVAGISIPFAMSIGSDEWVIEVDGIERPLVYDLTAPYDELGIDINKEQFNQQNIDLTKAIYEYFIPNLPNPGKVEASFDSIEVNGTQHNVRKIHAEVYGHELFELIESLLRNLVADEEGLRLVVDEFYELAQPVIDGAIRTSIEPYIEEVDPVDTLGIDLVLAYLDNKTLVTEFLYTTVHRLYEFALDQLDAAEAALVTADGSILNESSYASVDLYIDGSNNVIQSDVEIVVSPGSADPSVEAGGILITAQSQKWNINQPVEVEPLSSENGISLVDSMDEESILYAVDGSSTIGQMLSALGLNQKLIYVWLDEADVIVNNNTTLMHAYDLRYELGIELDWDSLYSDQVVLTDSSGTTTVVLPKDQNIIYVNDIAIEVPVGATETDYGVYLPLRAVAEAFGYEVSYDPVYRTVDLLKTYF